METGGPAARRSGWRRWLPWRSALALLVIGGLARAFLCAVLRVPTGSMEPALRGDPLDGDEILVVKGWHRLFAPDRFDLVVFERDGEGVPTDERVSVKRVAALGGESVRIEEGDLWITRPGGAEERVEKRRSAFRALRVKLHEESFDGSTGERWIARNPVAASFEPGAVVLDGSREAADLGVWLELASGTVRYEDGWLDEGGRFVPGSAPVQDVAFELDVEIDAATPGAGLVFGFAHDGDPIEFAIRPIASGHGVTLVQELLGTGARREHSASFWRIEPGERVTLEFWHVDGRVGFAIDGAVQVDEARAGGGSLIASGGPIGAVRFGALGGRIRLTRFEVWRDLHFTEPDDAPYAHRDEPYEVPEGELFVLGDSSSRSVDSRHFGSIRIDSLVGVPIAVSGPSGRRRFISSH